MIEEPENTSPDTTRSVFDRIVRESIAPRPRWHFLLREGVVIALGIGSVAIGSLAVAALLFEVRNTWWGAYDATHETLTDFVLDALPYLWFLVFGIFATAAYLSVRYTKRGYRYPLHIILGSSLLFSGAAGVCLYSTGIGSFVDEDMGYFMPFHISLIQHERVLWQESASGRVAGIVREISPTDPVVWIESTQGKPVRIDVAGFVPSDRVQVRIGDIIRVVGVPTTTPGVLQGCMVFMQPDDVLGREHTLVGGEMTERHQSRERNILVARSTECKGVHAFVRTISKDK